MYRQRIHFFPKTADAFMEVISAGEEFNKLAADRGWAQITVWVPTAGESEVIAESDYPDLATFQRETEAWFADPDAMAFSRKLYATDAARSPYNELLNTAPSLA
jgi:hypothetical protein